MKDLRSCTQVKNKRLNMEPLDGYIKSLVLDCGKKECQEHLLLLCSEHAHQTMIFMCII